MYLSFLRLLAADVSQTLDLGLQLLRLSGDLLDFVGHLLTFLMDLVALPGQQEYKELKTLINYNVISIPVVELYTPERLGHAAPSSLFSSVCGCSV